MKYLHNFKQEDEETLIFDVNNLSHSLLNAIRRLIISDVETIAFRTEYGKKSDIEIRANSSSLHNEFLANRISLVPIHIP
jgi:DNA-directed RNA polymerase alpha subunit